MPANQTSKLVFDFDFEGQSREALLKEAGDVFTAGLLGDKTAATPPPAAQAGISLLEKLNQQIAEFGRVPPEHLELKEEHFSEHGLPVPARFKDLSQTNRMLWLRLPIKLKKSGDLGFKKLMCAVEFNPNESSPARLPRSLIMLPTSKFKDIVGTSAEVKLIIGENLEFQVQTPEVTLEAGQAKLKIGAGVGIDQAAKMGFVAGPFNYELRKAEIEHGGIGTEEAYWTIIGEEFFQEADPVVVVVVQIPKLVTTIELHAVMQAYSTIRFDDNVLKYLTRKAAEFFRKGAPFQDEAVWSISLNQ